MLKKLLPASLRLTGIALLFGALCVVACAADDVAAGGDPLQGIKDFHDKFQKPGYFTSGAAGVAPPVTQEQISLGQGPAGLSGLVSVNADRQRDVLFNGALETPCANTMGIEVSGVTVIAVNTVKGGSATATSNIVLNPVQRIGSSGAEAEEKLK